jgi:hypothetical protein
MWTTSVWAGGGGLDDEECYLKKPEEFERVIYRGPM